MAQIKSIKLQDGTEFDVSGLSLVRTSDKGNLEISSPTGKKISLESDDNIELKPVGTLQLDTAHFEDDEDKDKFIIKTINDDGDILEGLELNTAGLTIKNNKADEHFWDSAKWVLKILKKKGVWMKSIFKAKSWDIRGMCQDDDDKMAPGYGGGIAIQIAGCDSSWNENKFKIETDRMVEISDTKPTSKPEARAMYNGEGGNGIEITTINSKMTSIYTGSYRFKADAPIYAVTRGAVTMYDDDDNIVTDSSLAERWDYPTQDDDSKDILPSDSCTWAEIVAAVKYLKKQGVTLS